MHQILVCTRCGGQELAILCVDSSAGKGQTLEERRAMLSTPVSHSIVSYSCTFPSVDFLYLTMLEQVLTSCMYCWMNHTLHHREERSIRRRLTSSTSSSTSTRYIYAPKYFKNNEEDLWSKGCEVCTLNRIEPLPPSPIMRDARFFQRSPSQRLFGMGPILCRLFPENVFFLLAQLLLCCIVQSSKDKLPRRVGLSVSSVHLEGGV